MLFVSMVGITERLNYSSGVMDDGIMPVWVKARGRDHWLNS